MFHIFTENRNTAVTEMSTLFSSQLGREHKKNNLPLLDKFCKLNFLIPEASKP